ncbi:MAG TPA: RNA polymerase sigma factor [Nocardioidaceae bacterium]|nr:RNA polymerase sigma factor [Nocardioidaceae bacterium]
MELTESTVADAKSGSTDAVSLVYRVLAPKVLGYLRSRGAEDPEGLTNEVFLAVIPRLTALEGGVAGLRTLVFSVAHARYVDETRRRTRRPVQTAYEQEYDERTTPSAEATAIEQTGSGRMMHWLGQLGEEQRSVIGLRILGDLSLEQTAQVLGKSTGAIKQLQRRGLENLRQLVERDGR